MKKLVHFSVSHPVTTSMFSFALILLGVLAFFRLETALLPDISFPRLTIVTAFADESPAGIEKRVTIPVEEALSGLRGLKTVSSVSSQGMSVVRLSFDWKAEINFVAMAAREKLDLIRNQLPQDASRPIVLKYDPNAAPLLSIACVPVNAADKDLRYFIKKHIKPKLRRIDGVGGIKLTGGYLPEIEVEARPAKLYALKMTLKDIVQIIARANFNTPAGFLPEGNKEVMVRTVGQFNKVRDIGDLIVSAGDGNDTFQLAQIVKVKSGFKDRQAETLFGIVPSVGLSVYVESGANQVDTAAKVQKKINILEQQYKKKFRFNVVVDRSKFISEAITNVGLAAVIGGVLAFFVLLFFLRRLSESIVLTMSIPISMAATLFLMFLAEITLNVISLGGLALGLGMTVDSGIVVVENIRKKIEAGGQIESSIIEGTVEVAGPVFASIITSIAVFLPIVFVTGLAGRLFGQMALTVSFALIVSVFTALSIIPTTLMMLEKKKRAKSTNKKKKASDLISEPKTPKVANLFNQKMKSGAWESFLKKTMQMKKRMFLFSLLMLLVAVPFFVFLDTGFLPQGKRKVIKAKLSFPSDMSLARKTFVTKRFLHKCEQLFPASHIYTEIGVDSSDPTAAASKRTQSSALVIISLKKISPEKAERKLQGSFGGDFPVPFSVKADTTLIEGINIEQKGNIFIYLSGDDLEAQKASAKFMSYMKNFSFIRKISADGLEKRREVKVEIDRKRSASIGIPVKDVASVVHMALSGNIATKFKDRDRQIDVRVRFDKEKCRTVEDLKQIYLRSQGGGLVQLSYLVNFISGKTESRLMRREGKRSYSYKILLKDRSNNTYKQLRDALKKFEIKHKVLLRIRGEEEEKNSLSGLLFAFVLAVILVYMVLASQFESFKMPLLVMVALPLSFVGSFVLLFVTGTALNLISAMGMIMLAGIVVNNAIVLYEKFKTSFDDGMSADLAAVEATISRTRPILMTTFTTLLGLLPLALGGATLQRDLALAVIGGLFSSTLFSLIFLPVFFSKFSGSSR